jgi:hypothetical protein
VRALFAAGGLILALAAAGCGRDSVPGIAGVSNSCTLAPAADIEHALGAKVDASALATDDGAPDEGCSWLADESGAAPRRLSFTIYRKKALLERAAPHAGHDFYDDEVQALSEKYARVGALDQVGEAAFMGVDSAATANRFSAEIVAIKGEDVLRLEIEGQDPSAFVVVAKAIAQKM